MSKVNPVDGWGYLGMSDGSPAPIGEALEKLILAPQPDSLMNYYHGLRVSDTIMTSIPRQ